MFNRAGLSSGTPLPARGRSRSSSAASSRGVVYGTPLTESPAPHYYGSDFSSIKTHTFNAKLSKGRGSFCSRPSSQLEITPGPGEYCSELPSSFRIASKQKSRPTPTHSIKSPIPQTGQEPIGRDYFSASEGSGIFYSSLPDDFSTKTFNVRAKKGKGMVTTDYSNYRMVNGVLVLGASTVEAREPGPGDYSDDYSSFKCSTFNTIGRQEQNKNLSKIGLHGSARF